MTMPMSASKNATTTPMNSEVRVPLQMRAHRSWPMELVPNQYSEDGPWFLSMKPVTGSLLMRFGSRWPGSSGCTNVNSSRMISTQRKNIAILFLRKARSVEPQ